MFRQIHLTYRLQQIIQCGASFKILYNNPLTQTLLFKDGKHIIEYNYGIQSITAKVSINIQETKLAIHACYDEQYELYFILCEGWKLNIYRKNLKILQTIHFDSKYNIGMVYNDGYMLLVGVEGILYQFNFLNKKEIDLYEVKIQCDERLLKFLSNIKITISQTKGRTRLDSGIEWIAGFAVIKEEFIFWGNKEFVIMTQNGIKHRCSKISNKDKVISKIIFSQLFMYYIIGYENGQIKIWRIGKKSELLIHTFDGHVKQVTELIEHRDKRLYWSSSPDMTLRLWNMEQFCNLYTITLSGFYSNLTLLTKDRFLVEQDHDVLLGFMNPNINLLYSVQSKVIGSIKHDNNLTLLLENHSAVLISGSDLEGNDLTKLPINQIFLPYKFIRDIQQALVKAPMYIILIDGGDLLLYRQDKNWQNIELQSEQIRDFNGNKMLQQIVCIQFSNLNIPCYDADFGQKSTFKRSDQLILGMSRGSIIFIQLHDPHQMYARMSYHREKIISLAEIDNILISFCEEGYLKLTSYQDGKIFCLKSFNSFKKIHRMLMFDNKAVFIQEKGPFQIFKYKNQQLRLFSYDKGNDHDSKVLSVDCLGDRKLYITAADDQKIKIWSSRKILLIQILLYDEINCAYILSGGLIIAHSGKISTIKQNFVKLHSVQPKQVNKDNKEIVGQYFEEFYQDEKALVIKQKIEQINIISNTPLQKKSVKLKQPNALYAGGKIINENDKQVIIYRLPNDTHRPKSKSQNVSAKRDRTVESDSRVLPSIFQNLNKEKQNMSFIYK